jgi:hypothetical protein
MFNPKNLFGSKSREAEITSLDLRTPPPPQKPLPDSPSAPAQRNIFDPTGQPAVDELKRRVQSILAGKTPNAFFLPVDPQDRRKVILLRSENPERKSLLFFSAPSSAADYARHIHTPAQIVGFNLDSLPGLARDWQAAGIPSFVMNRCPRCGTPNPMFPKDGLITKEQLQFAWATSWALRNWRGEALAKHYLAVRGEAMAANRRGILEYLRDHVDYNIPYVHWLIAIYAGMQGDEEARLASVARLEEFREPFVGRVTLMTDPSDPKPWFDSVAEADLGLLSNFGMLDHLQKPQST